MSRLSIAFASPTFWRKAALAAVCLGLIVGTSSTGHTQATTPQDALQFFKSYNFTGDVIVKSVDLQPQKGGGGFATGTIAVNGVPAGADVLFAFLYFEMVTSAPMSKLPVGSQFRGFAIEDVAKPVIPSVFLDPVTAPCWGPGSTQQYFATSWRVDVLRFLPVPGVNPDGSGTPTGKREANGAHAVRLPEAGTGNNVPSTAGASLVIGFRERGASLKTVVMYDGTGVKLRNQPLVTQTIRGFYDAAAGNARFYYIAGSGQPNGTDQIRFNDFDYDNDAPSIIGVNAILGDGTPASDRGWAAAEFDVSNQMGLAAVDAAQPQYGERVTVSLGHGSLTPYDCIITTAMVLTMETPDRDGDGHPDVLEESTSTLVDPRGQPLPNLRAMGADPDVKDIFYQADFLDTGPATYGPTTNGQCVAPACVVDPVGHTHRPPYESIKMVGDMFKAKGFRFHVDLGPTVYQVASLNENGKTFTPLADGYLVPPAHARGGTAIPENTILCVPNASNAFSCKFPFNQGTVGWKTKYQQIRDEALLLITGGTDPALCGPPPGLSCTPAPGEIACRNAERDGNPSTTCVRRFDPGRKNYIRYALFAHGLGLQKFSADDPTTPYDDTKIPVTFSGIADYPGGDMMITLGAFENFTGSPLQIASTWVHESGHTMWRKHYGDPPTPGAALLPSQVNCKPNYQSSMNYTYQLAGVTRADGTRTVDFSDTVLAGLDEDFLNEHSGLAGAGNAWKYRARWYSPVITGLDALVATPATRHCDGTPLAQGEVGLFKVESTTVTPPLDWDLDGLIEQNIGQDITFSGSLTNIGPGSADWPNLDWQQTGSRRYSGGSIDAYGAKRSLDVGDGDVGDGDVGDGDVGDGDVGDGDVGDGDVGDGDVGDGDVGDGDVGDGDVGDGDVGQGLEEVSAELAVSGQHVGQSAGGLTGVSQREGIALSWTPAPVAAMPATVGVTYRIYRAAGTTFPDATFNVNMPIAIVSAPTTTYLDTNVRNNQMYTYAVVTQFTNNGETMRSGFSNLVTVTKRP